MLPELAALSFHADLQVTKHIMALPEGMAHQRPPQPPAGGTRARPTVSPETQGTVEQRILVLQVPRLQALSCSVCLANVGLWPCTVTPVAWEIRCTHNLLAH